MTNEVVVLIVDDEPKVGGYLRILLERKIELKEKIIVHQATTIAGAVKMVNEFSPDIVFLDIQMQEKVGLIY